MNVKMITLIMLAAAPLPAEEMLIDLPTALRLADRQNSALALQVERLNRADLDVDAALYQWTPTLRLCQGDAWQDGALQNPTAPVTNAGRTARYTAFRPGAMRSGWPAPPGPSAPAVRAICRTGASSARRTMSMPTLWSALPGSSRSSTLPA